MAKKYVQDVRQCAANFTSVIFKEFPQQFCEVHDSISISEAGKLRLGVRATTALCKWHTLKTQLPDLASGAQMGFQPSLAPSAVSNLSSYAWWPCSEKPRNLPKATI